jgi:rhodanese-related sulfurtransferase
MSTRSKEHTLHFSTAKKIILAGLFIALLIVLARYSPSHELYTKAGIHLAAVSVWSKDIDASNVTLIDLRTPEEFKEGHIAGATLIDATAPDFTSRIATLPKDGYYFVYCRSGNRSRTAVNEMRALRFQNIVELDGGTNAWTKSGKTLVR